MTSKGNSGRPFVMMAMEPQWERENNQGVRPGAQIEFVVDLQLAACDGCRFFVTKACLVTVSGGQEINDGHHS